MPHPPRRDEIVELPVADSPLPDSGEEIGEFTPALLPGAVGVSSVIHPQKWTEEQVRDWWDKRTKRTKEVEPLSKGTDGRNIMRWNVNRFEQMCKGDTNLAAALYQDLRNEVQRFEHYRKTGVVLKAASISPKPGPCQRRRPSVTRSKDSKPTPTAAQTQPLSRNGLQFNPAPRGTTTLKPKFLTSNLNLDQGGQKIAVPAPRASERKVAKVAPAPKAAQRASSNGASGRQKPAFRNQGTSKMPETGTAARNAENHLAEVPSRDGPVVSFSEVPEVPERRRSLVMEDIDGKLHQLSTATRREKAEVEKPKAMDDTAIIRRTKSARLAAEAKGKESESEDATRQMFDKRELRKRHKCVYEQHIRSWCERYPKEDCPAPEPCRVRVYVRKRPLFPHEEEADEFDVTTVTGRKVIIHNCLTKADLRSLFVSHMGFQFTNAFHESVSDDDVYEHCAGAAVQHVLDGNIAALFMFGQTGSGKTHTMSGLLQRASAHIFQQESTVTLTAFEIAGKVMRDLLDTNPKELKIREDKSGKTQILGLQTHDVSSSTDLLRILKDAQAHRATRATQVNETSSRSHAVFRISREAKTKDGAATLTLVDCAGSERREDTTQHDARSRKDAAEINSTIFALKECFRVMRSSKGQPPYRESLLTRVLSDSFASEQAMVVAIGTVSPSAKDTEHSIGTLRALQQLQGTQMSFEEREDILKPKQEVEVQAHPKTWSEAEVRQWFEEACGGKAKAFAATISKGTDGKNLLRWPNQRFTQQCEGDEDLGHRLYQELRLRMRAAGGPA